MKTLRRFLVMGLLSLIIATGLFFINSNVIVTGFFDKVAEIFFTAVPVFIIITILYYVNRALVRSVKSIKNKKPSDEEGFDSC